jgi:hypothetical protein
MATIQESINTALQIEGTLGVALGDWNTGFSLAQASLAPDVFSTEKLEQAIALNAEVIKAKNKVRDGLNIDSPIEDIVISLSDQYHMIRLCESASGVFFYLVMERADTNLGLARIKLREIERMLHI